METCVRPLQVLEPNTRENVIQIKAALWALVRVMDSAFHLLLYCSCLGLFACIVLCYDVSYLVLQYCAVLCCAVLCCAVLCCAVLLCCIVKPYTVQLCRTFFLVDVLSSISFRSYIFLAHLQQFISRKSSRRVGLSKRMLLLHPVGK